MTVDRTVLLLAALLGATGVALGAFAAHGLEATVRPERVPTFETAVRYQLVHAAALLALAPVAAADVRLRTAAIVLAAGVATFSGSLYVLVAADASWLGMVAPVGGALMVLGWVLLGAAALRRRPGA